MSGTILIGIDIEKASEISQSYAEKSLELFASEGVPATWYLTGRTLERNPEVFLKVAQSGLIDLQCHTYDHILLKTVLIEVPPGCTVHGSTGWHMCEGSSNEQIDADLQRCQELFQTVLGRKATGLTCPWCYYRGLADRPDLLAIVHRHGFRFLRAFGRNERDAQPVPLDWQPFFYDVQGFADMLELFIHDYQDDWYYAAFNGLKDTSTYPAHLRKIADRVAADSLIWSLCTHDRAFSPGEDNGKLGWLFGLIGYAKSLGIRFMTAADYYAERVRQGRDLSS